MKERPIHQLRLSLLILRVLLLSLCFGEFFCGTFSLVEGRLSAGKQGNGFLPELSPSGAPQPFLPLLAPTRPAPFTNTSAPKLLGLCILNFNASESLMSMTAIDCWTVFSPLLANVICCPQLEGTIAVLIGQSSRDTNILTLNETIAEYCLSDIEQILVAQGGSDSLKQVCSIHSSNVTDGSCPVKDVQEFESTVDTSKLLDACGKIDLVRECCDAICQNAISEAASEIALKSSDALRPEGSEVLPEHLTWIHDCKSYSPTKYLGACPIATLIKVRLE